MVLNSSISKPESDEMEMEMEMDEMSNVTWKMTLGATPNVNYEESTFRNKLLSGLLDIQ